MESYLKPEFSRRIKKIAFGNFTLRMAKSKAKDITKTGYKRAFGNITMKIAH